jgi:gliding motility-associated protein GldM
MAGGKLTPRQKMINLMYLVFVAMLAMNMSKEVLSAFGLMNERFEGANNAATSTNELSLAALDKKASEAKGEFAIAAVTAHKVEAATKKFYDFVGTLKSDVLTGIEPEETGKLPYESMDKADNLDNAWFAGEGYADRGKQVIAAIETYKSEMKAALGSEKKFASVLSEIEQKFNVGDVKNKEGIPVKFLDYHFKGFPAIASLAKLSAWQNDAKKAESDVIAAALGKAAVNEASMSKFQAIVVMDKSAYFQGEKVTGKVVLGKYDPNAKFSGFSGPGRLVNGQAVIETTASGVGERDVNGSFNFVEDGKSINLPFKGKYVVMPRPNQAIISADKMNVVYRGVDNPISVSIPGVPADKVNASAPGMRSAGKQGSYILRPGAGGTVKITASGKLSDGKTVSSSVDFRIKNLPSPTGMIRSETNAKGPRSSLEASTVSAIMQDFDFPISVTVKQFNLKVPGSPTVVVQGNRMSAAALSAIKKAGKGDVVTISEIKAAFVGLDQIPRSVSPCSFEIQ